MNQVTRATAQIGPWALFIYLLASGVSPNACAQQYPFLPVPGSPKGVTAIFQDSKGRLWLGGVQPAVFEGTQFYFLRDYGLPAGELYSTGEDASGAIWLGAESGLYRFSNGHVEQIGKAVVTSVAVASPDLVFASVGPLGRGIPAKVSLVRIRRIGSVWKIETMMALESPGPITLDRGGMLLYPRFAEGWDELAVAELGRWEPGKQLIATSHPVAVPRGFYADARRVVRDSHGCVWIGGGSTSYTCDGKTWLDAPFDGGARTNPTLSEAPDGSMILSGNTLLAVGRPGSFRIARATNGLPALNAAMAGSDGTIWLGGAAGLFRCPEPFRLEYWTQQTGVEAPQSVERNGSEIYAGLGDRIGLLTKDRQRWQTLAAFPDIGEVANLKTTKDGNMLAALDLGGAALLRRDGTVLARSGSPASYGLRLAILPDGEAWLGGLRLAAITRSGSELKMADHRLTTVPYGNVVGLQYEGQTRRLWACYTGGLVVRGDDGRWSEITTKDGLLTNPCWSLAALPNGDVWYGYFNTPAFALVHPESNGRVTVRQFRESDEIRDAESTMFEIDRRGWIWRGGNHGLSVANATQAEAGKWLHFDQSDGLSGEALNNLSFLDDADGSVWMGIDNSILHYTPPADLLAPQSAPQVFLSSFSWDGTGPKLADAAGALPWGAHAVAHIGSLQFDRRSALRVRYRILPEQADWRESASLDVPLREVASGAHTLEVQGRIFTGPWSSTATRSFTILPPLWRSRPLLWGYLAISMLLAIGAYLLERKRKADLQPLLPELGDWQSRVHLPEIDDAANIVLDARFEVRRQIGQGGFANVFEGYDLAEQRRCAVKVFRDEVKDKEWMQERFTEEVSALEKVRHPNVVAIYAHGKTSAGALYFAMEFIEGKDLRTLLSEGALARARVGRCVRQLADALDAIHALGICHRDVKPENVIIRNAGLSAEEAVLIDFSIAIIKDASTAIHGLSRVAGSIDYMAPEQLQNHAAPSSDIYSLAKVAIELLTGRQLERLLPAGSFPLPDPVRILLRSADLGLSRASIDMLAAALEFDPRNRPAVAASVFAMPIVRDLQSDGGEAQAGWSSLNS